MGNVGSAVVREPCKASKHLNWLWLRGSRPLNPRAWWPPLTLYLLAAVQILRINNEDEFFCRAMLCISSAIAVMRCLSVRPPVCHVRTFVDHIKTNKHIFEIFSPSGSHTILVFPYQTGWRYSDRNPLTGVSNAGGYRQKWRFWSNSWLSKIAGRAKCQNIYRRRSGVYDTVPRTTGYRSIAGRANYEVTKTVTDDHAV